MNMVKPLELDVFQPNIQKDKKGDTKMESNKIGDIIKRLMEIRDQYGDDVEVKADTQDGGCYSVYADEIQVETLERRMAIGSCVHSVN